MSKLVFWILVASIIVALVIMIVTFIIMRLKITKIKNKYSLTAHETIDNPALNREDNGVLLWEEKEKTKNPLPDMSMEFAVNTIIRNKYHDVMLKGFEEKYEEETIKKVSKSKIVKDKYNFALINFNDSLIDEIDDILKKAQEKSIIMIVNTPKQKAVKSLLSYFKYTGIRNEFQKIDKGIILIAK